MPPYSKLGHQMQGEEQRAAVTQSRNRSRKAKQVNSAVARSRDFGREIGCVFRRAAATPQYRRFVVKDLKPSGNVITGCGQRTRAEKRGQPSRASSEVGQFPPLTLSTDGRECKTGRQTFRSG